MTIRGIVASKGFAMGRAAVLVHEYTSAGADGVKSWESEIVNFKNAFCQAHDEIMSICGKEGSGIKTYICACGLVTIGKGYFSRVTQAIQYENLSAESAIKKMTKHYIDDMQNTRNGIEESEIKKIQQFSELIIAYLDNPRSDICDDISDNTIIITDNLSIKEINQINDEKVIGIIMEQGTITSHATLVAKMLGIPLMIQTKKACKLICNNDFIILDGDEEAVVIHGNSDIMKKYMNKKIRYYKSQKKYEDYRNKKTCTKDGIKVKVSANISNIKDAEKAIENGAEGIGLYRTEMEFFKYNKILSEEEQYNIYKKVIMQLNGLPITFRTLDFGGDKRCHMLDNYKEEEENPFMGLRGIRYLLNNKDLLFNQLCAIFRASIYGNVKMMIPMVSSVNEIIKVKELIGLVKQQLDQSKTPYKVPVFGIMIEVPAAAVVADIMAEYVDFFSIGSNDLIQHTIGVDRGNVGTSHMYDEYHQAVLRMIEWVGMSGKYKNIPVSICGDIATNIGLVPLLIGLGVSELSVPSRYIGEIRWVINNLCNDDIEQAKKALIIKAENKSV